MSTEQVSEKNFSLQKVKFLKGGGLGIHCEETVILGDETYTGKVHAETAMDAHPDLKEQLNNLRPIVGRIFGLTSFLSMTESKGFDATEDQKTIARETSKKLLDNIEIRGISLSGKDDNVGVVITAIYTLEGNQKTCINTPRLKMANIKYGFEEELNKIVVAIEQETYKYRWENKYAQQEIFNGGEIETGEENENGFFPDVNDPAEDE